MTTIGKYELLEKLGEGATAEVYHAFDTVMKRHVALKLLKPSLVTDANAFEHFSQEAQTVGGLFHENIATAIEIGSADGRYFIAMRYVSGQSLDKMLQKGSLPWADVLRLTQQIGAALDVAHKKGFIHRDVKPSNIIWSSDGEFVLSDFGLTHAMTNTSFTSFSGNILGTPAYIAPEVWSNKAATPATDQYAFACVVYEALTGKVLFDGNTPPAIMGQHVLTGPQLPAKWPRPDVPAGIETVLRRALAKDPNERYPNLAAFSAACAQPSAIQTLPPSQLSPKVEKKTGSSVGCWVVLAVLLLMCFVIGGFGGFGWFVNGLLPAATTDSPTLSPTDTIPPIATATIAEIQPPLAATETLLQLPTLSETSTPLSIAPADGETSTPATSGTNTTTHSEKDQMELIFVPAGQFEMGSNNTKTDEKPAHLVFLDAFWIDKTEVTNAMYDLCYMDGKCELPKNLVNYMNPEYAHHPVGYVDWENAQKYCTWAERRLPTEAEWEKAARGPAENLGEGRIYPWGNQPPKPELELLNYYYSHFGNTVEVGKYPKGASPYGVLDMAGNVWEWVADWYDGNYYKNSPTSNPQGPSSGDERVLRGGSWYNIDESVRSTIRLVLEPKSTKDSNGFRCAVSATP